MNEQGCTVDWARVRDHILARALVTIRHHCWHVAAGRVADTPAATLAAVGAIADLVHTLPQIGEVTRDDLLFLAPHLDSLGLGSSRVAELLAER